MTRKKCHRYDICEHQRQRNQCKDCGGGGLCEHQRRSTCKDCGGSSQMSYLWHFCGRGTSAKTVEVALVFADVISVAFLRQRNQCKDCGGGGLCEHQRRSTCKDCGGSGICEHQRARSKCKACGGNSICKHQHLSF